MCHFTAYTTAVSNGIFCWTIWVCAWDSCATEEQHAELQVTYGYIQIKGTLVVQEGALYGAVALFAVWEIALGDPEVQFLPITVIQFWAEWADAT